MSEQDLHGEPVTEPVVDVEAVVDERDELTDLGSETPVDVEAPEGDAVEQRLPAGDAAADEDYPPH